MNAKIRYYLTFIGMFLLSGIALAAPETDKISFLNPPVTDKSINYLAQIFGNVGTVLHGTGGQLLSKVFEIFNLGILVIASVFATYTIFKSVLSTAQDGEFMGKQGKFSWVAVRTCLGVGFLAPVFGGYSAIQVLMMWVVIHGVGFADAAWERALNYMKQGGQVYTPPQDEQVRKMINNSTYVLKAQICMYSSKRMAEKKNKDIQEKKQNPVPGTPPVTDKPETGSYAPEFDKKTPKKYNFPGGIGEKYSADGCGSVTYKGISDDFQVEIPEKNFVFIANPPPSTQEECAQAKADALWKAYTSKIDIASANDQNKVDRVYQACLDRVNTKSVGGAKEGVVQMALDLAPIAQKMAYSDSIANPNLDEYDASRNEVVAAILGAAADFVNITLPQRATGTDDVPEHKQAAANLENYYKNAVADGWITAGALYYELGRLQRKHDVSSESLFTPGAALTTNKEDYKTKLLLSPEISDQAAKLVGNAEIYAAKATTAADDMARSNKQDKASAKDDDTSFESGEVGKVGWGRWIKDISRGWRDNIDMRDNGNPIMAMQRLGNTNLDVAGGLYMATIIATPILSVLGTIVLGNGIPLMATNLLLIIIPILIAISTSMFTTGAVLAIYVPMIPYLLFIFGAIGWVISVVEAMVAAPLVALGVTHPEGHDLLGKSEQALMLMLGVFLKPVLMVIGMLGGIVLSFVSMRMINVGFNALTNAVLYGTGKAFGGLTAIAIVIILEIVYCSIVVAVINQAYSLIYHVPDKVLRWIGAPELGGGRPEALGKIEQATEGAGKEVGSRMADFNKKASKKLSKSATDHLSKEDSSIK